MFLVYCQCQRRQRYQQFALIGGSACRHYSNHTVLKKRKNDYRRKDQFGDIGGGDSYRHLLSWWVQEELDEALQSLEKATENYRNHWESDTETFEWNYPERPREMVSKSEGICYLVYVSGRFEGVGEAVEIVELGETWYLQGREGPGGTNISARATCWKFPSVN